MARRRSFKSTNPRAFDVYGNGPRLPNTPDNHEREAYKARSEANTAAIRLKFGAPIQGIQYVRHIPATAPDRCASMAEAEAKSILLKKA